VVDISDPVDPVTVSVFDLGGSINSIDVSGNYAFTVGYDPYLKITNITDPLNLSLEGTCNISSNGYEVKIAGDLAYIGTGSDGVKIIDVSDPSNPSIIGSTNEYNDNVSDIEVVDNLCYVAWSNSGLFIFDVSDPTTPDMVNSVDPGRVDDIEIQGEHAYLACSSGGVYVYDISSAPEMTMTGYYDTWGYSYNIKAQDNWAFISSFKYFGVYDCSEALPVKNTNPEISFPETLVLSAHPNPFNPTTQLSFDLPKAGSVEVVIYDIFGRQIAELLNDWRNPGSYQVNFNAEGLSSGIYFARIKSSDFNAEQKLIYLK